MTACATCPAPTSLTTTYPSSTEANLGWTEAGTATTWNIEWGTTGFAQGTGTMITGTTTNPYLLIGLTAGTDYDFYVQSDCGGSTSTWTGPHTWTQPNEGDDCTLPIVATVEADCGSATPLTLDFANATNETLPTCDVSGNYGYWVKATTPASGALKITNTGTSIGLAIYDACGGNEVYCNNNTLGAETSLSGFTGNADYYFYFWRDAQSGTADICFEAVNCLFPTSLATSNIMATSADLSWDAGGSETVWNIEYGPDGYTQGTGTTISGVSTNPYNLTGLTEGTDYDWYIQADCAASGGTDQSAWSGPASFTTLPNNDDCANATALTVGTNGTCPGNQVSSTSNGATDDGTTTCDASDNFGVWYTFTAPASGEVVINYTAGTATGNPGVAVFDACGGTEVAGTCQDNTASLANITGLTAGNAYKLLLWFDSGMGTFDICLEDIPACANPTAQTESNILHTSVDLDWTEAGLATTWDLEWGATGYTQGTGTMITGITTKPYNLSGLTAGTTYDWYVRADCGGGSLSPWTGPSTFTTTQPGNTCDDPIVVSTLPYTTTDNTSNYGDDYSSTDEDCNNSSYLNGDDVVYSYTPAANECVDITLTNTGTYVGLFVYDGCNPFTCVDSDTQSGGNPSLTGVNLTGGTTYYFVISTWPTPQSTAYDLEVKACPTCPDPSAQTETNLTDVSVDLGWTENGTATTWNIEWGLSGFTQGTGTMVTGTTTNPHSLSGLTANTDYDWYVQADCGGGDKSTWVGPKTFTTLDPPPANDECTGAIVAAVNADQTCTSLTSGSTVGATESMAGCVGTANDDVWFKFVATYSSHDFSLENRVAVSGSSIDMVHQVFEGTCGSLTSLSCSDPESSSVSGLTVGNTYYVRVYSYYSSSRQTFDLCIKTPPCEIPTSLSATNETLTSADLSWTENGGATSWDIELGPTGFTPTGTPTQTGVTNPYTYGGLSASTTYDWYVRADCGASGGTGQSDWSAKGTFTTASADAVDWCNLQWPDAHTMEVGNTVDVYARVNEAGVTPGAGQGAGITAWIGYSDANSNPSSWTNWVSATYFGDADGLTPGDLANDEYKVALGSGMAPGTYYYASRFKLNSGAYSYGGYSAGGGGFWDGSTYVSGVLTIDPVTGDMLCDAIALTVDAAPAVHSNTNCTQETDEPNGSCWNGTSGDFESIWFSFEAPATGSVEVSTDFDTPLNDTHIAMYEVSNCNDMTTLVEKGCDEDGGDTGSGWNSIMQVDGLTPGNTYYVQVDGYSSNDGEFNIEVTKRCNPNMTVLPASATATTSTGSCVDGDWTHYYDGSNNILLSLKLGTSGAVITDVTVDPAGATNAEYFLNDADGFPQVQGASGAAFMKRKWDVNASTQPSSDVGVRFYYTQAEFDAVNAEIINQGETPLGDHLGLNFYKVTSGEDPFNIGPGGIGTGDYILILNGATAGTETWVKGTYDTEHYAEYLVSGFSGGGGGGASGAALLPIDLASFSGYADKVSNVLKWTTLTETNTSMFNIERSANGKEWTQVAQLDAAGNSRTKLQYKATDDLPLSSAYYRLKIVDLDGRVQLSDMILITRSDKDLKLNSLYPNPNDGNFVLNITSANNEDGKIIIVNTLGVKVHSQDLNRKGGTSIEKINVSHLPNGIYTLLIEQNDQIITKRIAINK